MRSRLSLPALLMRNALHCCFGCVLLYTQVALAEPLDLLQAMDVGTEELQPALFAVRASQESARADSQRAASSYALEADINLEAARIEPAASALDQSSNDSIASLNIRKPLYDFGYTSSKLQAAETGVDAEQLAYAQALAEQQILIAQSFFAAILSDIKFAWDNEAMAMLYVRVDKIRDRYELKLVSEVELLKAEAEYQQVLTLRRHSEIAQRITRAQLAEVINQPGELASELVVPKVELKNLQLPDPEALIKLAMQANLALNAQAKRVAAAQEAMAAARKQLRPLLGAEVEVNEYARDLPSREDWRASLNLKIPLFENALMKSEVADKRALWLQQRAIHYQLQSDLRRQIYDVWMLLSGLEVKATELETAARAADRALDKSRGEYELELRTDYGDTLVNSSRIRYEQNKNNFAMIVAAMRLTMLVGLPPRSVIANHKVSLLENATGEINEN